MFSLRGDAHKFYLKLKKEAERGIDISKKKEIQELDQIRRFYKGIDTTLLININYWIRKEKSGSGLIPILITAIPWILFIFSKQVQAIFHHDDHYLWLVVVLLYIFAVTLSVVIHFKERAWATLHAQIIEDILTIRKQLEK
ncbi:hypothetical protein [Halalkalibacter krulwichiae]|uniref:Uncharacterized protein n=1 Tax=Halalkalibacter krulwichiae TaxID=199441 RepID=A0A1X9MBR8_9BACI|nr:hypothetical protein [Halalkalibacter krulwichiae]ARK30885.1 hypothetical protein BkAM31D_14130 [Halalkalibacter krulwichiae]